MVKESSTERLKREYFEEYKKKKASFRAFHSKLKPMSEATENYYNIMSTIIPEPKTVYFEDEE